LPLRATRTNMWRRPMREDVPRTRCGLRDWLSPLRRRRREQPVGSLENVLVIERLRSSVGPEGKIPTARKCICVRQSVTNFIENRPRVGEICNAISLRRAVRSPGRTHRIEIGWTALNVSRASDHRYLTREPFPNRRMETDRKFIKNWD
jgi:hypothetical protein